MFLPLSAEGKLQRPPWATIGLIVVNVVVFALAWPVEQEQTGRAEIALQELLAIEWELEQRYLGGAVDGPAFVPSRIRGRNDFETRFWRSFAEGRLVPEDHEDLVAWRGARHRYQTARSASLYFRFGIHPENRNPLALVTSMFLHFGFMHLAGNMLFLWISGASVEDVWGWQLFLLIYLASGILAQLPDAFLAQRLDVVAAGASGAVAGMMGAFLVRHARKRIRFLILPMIPTVLIPAWVLIALWALSEFRAALSGAFTGVGHAVHVAGFATGALFALGLRWGNADAAVKGQLARTDRRKSEARRRKHEKTAAYKAERGDVAGMRDDLEAACRIDPRPHETFRQFVEQLVHGGDGARAAEVGRSVLEACWQEGRPADATAAFTVLRAAGLQGHLPTAMVLRALRPIERENPSEAARSLWELLRDRADDPLHVPALDRYASLLQRLGDAEGAAAARRQLALVRERNRRAPA